ncbi:MAG: hypothetical protein KGL53_05855, partial [Elusimicrobia bacterium]|nr:hypothetical protein [Elusimicrobiota bacterium]
MRARPAFRLLLAALASWLVLYQVCDRGGDAFKNLAARAAVQRGGPAFAAHLHRDRDAFVPLVLGRTLLSGVQGPSAREAFVASLPPSSRAAGTAVAPSACGARAPPGVGPPGSLLPRRPLAFRARLRALAPPLA